MKKGVFYVTGKSRDVVKLPNKDGDTIPAEKAIKEINDSRERSYIRTRERVKEIRDALNDIKYLNRKTGKKDEGYPVVELRYFDGMPFERIAEELNMSISTVYRHRSRLINKLAVFLFGVDALI